MGSSAAGILLGLGLAFLQTLSYFLSRRFITVVLPSPLVLLSVSHVQMGLISLAILALSPLSLEELQAAWKPAIGAAGFYLLGQWCLFRALRDQPASRISPLLGLKVVVLAVISVLWGHEPLSAWQWLGVVLSATAAWLLNEMGGRLSMGVLFRVGGAVTGYALSDLQVVQVVKALRGAPGFAPLTGMAMSYVVCGIAMLPVAFRRTARAFRVWKHALPFALSWLASMVLLFACFDAVGVVLGNIVQATRGLMTILVGYALAHVEWAGVKEQRLSRKLLGKRLVAAVLMTLAVAVYVGGDKFIRLPASFEAEQPKQREV